MENFKITIMKKDNTPEEDICCAKNPVEAIITTIQNLELDPNDFKSIFVSNINP